MIFLCSVKSYASKSQFIKAGGKIKFQTYARVGRSWLKEIICGLIILSKKVSATYTKTAIPANLCLRSLGPLERTEDPLLSCLYSPA